MGLQDVIVMSAVPAHHVSKPSRLTAKLSAPNGQADSLEESLRAMTVHKNHQHNSSGTANNSVADDKELHGLEFLLDDDDDEGDGSSAQWMEADDARLTKALHSWRRDYVITPLPRQGHTLRQPVFSARLGRETAIRRASSSESVDTQLSLFSCSSHGSRMVRKKRRRIRRRKTLTVDQPTPLDLLEAGGANAGEGGSRWVELAKKRKGELDRFMMAQSHTLAQGINLTGESEAFQLCDPDEQRALYQCGKLNTLLWAGNLRKSPSTTNVCLDSKGREVDEESRSRSKPRPSRPTSAGAKTFFGKPIDFQELRRQLINQKLAALNAAHRPHHTRSGWRALRRTLSKHSVSSVGSNEVFFSANTPHNTTPPPGSRPESASGPGSGPAQKGGETTARTEGSVSMWKGDNQILAIDLKRELTTKVKQRIVTTTTALERVTGVGDDNEQRPYTCHLAEFPSHVDEDFARQPRIPQRIRISPHLSEVIKGDIRVRMGRPRYHEIRVRDLEIWNRGQTLDRAHRNLKVFNWLHSLKEEEFELTSLRQDVSDEPPGLEDVSYGDMVLVRAVDDPDVKPLYQRNKTFIR